MEINQIIGNNLKKIREAQNLTLGQLAELSGISKVMLSQIEKGTSNPTINTIWKIASGLNVTYSSLLEYAEQEIRIISKNDISVQDDKGYKIYCYYPTTPSRNFEMYQIEIEPGCEHTSIGHSELSEEYIIVTNGILTMEIGDKEYILQQGNAITFEASEQHTYKNNTDKTAQMSLVIYYKS